MRVFTLNYRPSKIGSSILHHNNCVRWLYDYSVNWKFDDRWLNCLGYNFLTITNNWHYSNMIFREVQFANKKSNNLCQVTCDKLYV